MCAMLEMGLYQHVIYKPVIRTSQLDECAITFLSGGGLGSEHGIVGIFIDEGIGFTKRIVPITGPRVVFGMLDQSGADGIALDVAAGFEEVTLLLHEGTFIASLPEVAHVAGLCSIPAGVFKEQELHELGEHRAVVQLAKEMEVVAHQAVVGKRPAVFAFRLRQESGEGLEAPRYGKDKEAIIPAGNEMVAAAVKEPARLPGHYRTPSSTSLTLPVTPPIFR